MPDLPGVHSVYAMEYPFLDQPVERLDSDQGGVFGSFVPYYVTSIPLIGYEECPKQRSNRVDDHQVKFQKETSTSTNGCLVECQKVQYTTESGCQFECKREMRRRRNRDHARNSREKKRQRVEQLAQQNEEYRIELEYLRTENMNLRLFAHSDSKLG